MIIFEALIAVTVVVLITTFIVSISAKPNDIIFNVDGPRYVPTSLTTGTTGVYIQGKPSIKFTPIEKEVATKMLKRYRKAGFITRRGEEVLVRRDKKGRFTK